MIASTNMGVGGSGYVQFANNEVKRLDERMAWLSLAEFDGAERLDDASLMRLQGLVTRARWRAQNISGNLRYTQGIARDMGIELRQHEQFDRNDLKALCAPILPKQ